MEVEVVPKMVLFLLLPPTLVLFLVLLDVGVVVAHVVFVVVFANHGLTEDFSTADFD
jgi:hypothetical protein